MQKVMIDNSKCSSANWMQVLQNSLTTKKNFFYEHNEFFPNSNVKV
jgi:hypothetical protein